MLIYIFLVLALAAAPLTVYFTDIHHAFGILLFFGYYVGLVALFFFFGLLMAPTLSKKKEIKKPNRFARFMLLEAYCFAGIFARMRIKVTGREKLPKRGTTFLVVSNHLSNFDHMIMLTKLRRYPIVFISKPENFNIFAVGRYLKHSGFLSIDRKSARNALSTINETARRISECGMCYGVFPEGTRSRNGKLLPFHSGVFLSAKKANAPILVIHMDGTDRVTHRMPWRSTRVKMDILEYLPAEYTAEHTDKEISEYTYQLMLTTGQEPYRKPEQTPAESGSEPNT